MVKQRRQQNVKNSSHINNSNVAVIYLTILIISLTSTFISARNPRQQQTVNGGAESLSSSSFYDNIYSALAEFSLGGEDEQQQNDDEGQLSRRSDETNRFSLGANIGEDLLALESSRRQVRSDDMDFARRQIAAATATNQQQQTRVGRQTAGSGESFGRNPGKVVVDGFPSGLPAETPLGVKIALRQMLEGPEGDMPAIPGVAGVDFPIYNDVPTTSFDCDAQAFIPGIYADPEAQCQVFFMCQPNSNFNSFLCPNGTIFNQKYFVCDWWYNTDCGKAEDFYAMNEFLYETIVGGDAENLK